MNGYRLALFISVISIIKIHGKKDRCNEVATLNLLHEHDIHNTLYDTSSYDSDVTIKGMLFLLRYNQQEINETDIVSSFEASGVVLRPDGLMMYIIFDNSFRIGAFCTRLAIQTNANCKNMLLKWPDDIYNTLNSEFEGIAYNPLRDTYLVAQETVASSANPDEYNSNTFEIEIKVNSTYTSIKLIESCRVMWKFNSTARGFEGIELMIHEKRNKTYLLALCEGQKCTATKAIENTMNDSKTGRIVVFEKREINQNHSCQWEAIGILDLSSNAAFLDYSALSVYQQNRSTYVAVTSQQNSQLWIGILEEIDESPFFRVNSSMHPEVYNFPLALVNDTTCAKQFCNVEGVAWINGNELVFVSDQSKKSQGDLCASKDQSIHYFSIQSTIPSKATYSQHCGHLVITLNLYLIMCFLSFYN